MAWATYKEKLRKLSQTLVEIQRPIRILDSIKWDSSFESELKKSKFKLMPKIDRDYYSGIPLGYDLDAKTSELEALASEIKSELGDSDSLGMLLLTNVDQYIDVVKMLKHRGTKKFWEMSKKLYGSPKDTFFEDHNKIRDLGQMMYGILSKIDIGLLGPDFIDDINAEKAVEILGDRFKLFFKDDPSVRVKLADGIVADASAGGDIVKIRAGAMFSMRDIDILEVHEGWVHIGTTQNGNHQHIAKWLSKGPPRVASTQEGLAVITEIFTFRSFPKRARQINDRILGIDKAEDGANLLEVIEFYRTEGYTEDECLANARRVFRGGLIEGGAPFTKDIAYCKGFIENYNFMRAAIRAGKPHLIPFLFTGKVYCDDVPLLYQKYKEGIIDPPRYLPPQFKDMNGVTVWLSFSSFLNLIDLKRVQEHYDKLFSTYL